MREAAGAHGPVHGPRVEMAADGSADFALNGRIPAGVLRPKTEEESAAAVAWAVDARMGLVPWGGGTEVQHGNPVASPRWAVLSSELLNQVLDYSPDDMVVTCQAGVTLAALSERLRSHRQFLPIDAPHPDRATMGGIVAGNSQGLWRPLFGAPRDRLLGLRAVMADGQTVKGGGKVVKNVAGYDLCKLFAGSRGTLGFLTEVTFKTSPLPECCRHVVFRAQDAAAAVRAGLAVHAARLQPLYATVAYAGHVHLCVGLQGSAAAVAWQADRVAEACSEEGLAPSDEGPSDQHLRILVADSPAPVKLRFTLRPWDLVGLLRGLEALGQRGAGLTLAAHVPTGIVAVAMQPGAPDAESAVRLARAARLQVGGECHLVWTRLPESWRPSVGDVWGPTRGDFPLMRSLKRALDPDGLFSPGRFVGRL